jgi:hypothetical protein
MEEIEQGDESRELGADGELTDEELMALLEELG